jgi:hypothetical protein
LKLHSSLTEPRDFALNFRPGVLEGESCRSNSRSSFSFSHHLHPYLLCAVSAYTCLLTASGHRKYHVRCYHWRKAKTWPCPIRRLRHLHPTHCDAYKNPVSERHISSIKQLRTFRAGQSTNNKCGSSTAVVHMLVCPMGQRMSPTRDWRIAMR